MCVHAEWNMVSVTGVAILGSGSRSAFYGIQIRRLPYMDMQEWLLDERQARCVIARADHQFDMHVQGEVIASGFAALPVV